MDGMKTVGEYQWEQISIWDFAPEDCIETYVRSSCGKHVFHFYLRQVTEVISDTHWKVVTVTSTDGVPEEVLNWRNGKWRVRVGGKRV